MKVRKKLSIKAFMTVPGLLLLNALTGCAPPDCSGWNSEQFQYEGKVSACLKAGADPSVRAEDGTETHRLLLRANDL